MKQKNKKGFTLVELSIVLVIIGLLIGGILVGQSLIESAKMQSFIRQIGQYDAATATFKDKFGNLPGDNTLFGTTCTATCVGGDGIVTQTAAATALVFNGEIGGFWNDLQLSGLKNEQNSGVFTALRLDGVTVAPVAGNHIPLAKIGTGLGVMTWGVAGANYYAVSSFAATNALTAISTSASVRPADALAVDTKLDDGLATTGNVRGGDQTTLTLTPAAGTCAATNAYVVTTTTGTCNLNIRIGSATGVLN